MTAVWGTGQTRPSVVRRLCSCRWVRGLYQLWRKMGCFSSSLEGGRSEGWSSRQRRVTSRRPGDRWVGIVGAVVALAIWGRRQWLDSWPNNTSKARHFKYTHRRAGRITIIRAGKKNTLISVSNNMVKKKKSKINYTIKSVIHQDRL